ncbi:MAG: HdeD family acid-resistance protein [Gammaproteobacteria bacterium]|nr:MAG: HdeD family acid-resistance protein [Gammaproteobacteria bacterium]
MQTISNKINGTSINVVRENWGWLLFIGVLMVVLGVIGLSMEFALTITSLVIFGCLMLVGGALQLVDVFKAKEWKSKLWYILIALMYAATGLVMIIFPGASAVWITLFIGASLLTTGLFRIIMGFQMRGVVKSWGWTIFSGFMSILLGLMILSEWPISGLWAIGLFIAVELIMQGFSMIHIALAAKSHETASLVEAKERV